jgi:hypothetical protein
VGERWVSSSRLVKFSFLYGITTRRLLRLLRDNRWQVSPRYLPRLLFHVLCSLWNSRMAAREERAHGTAIRRTRVEPAPLFIIGHWRSGTTHLHNLLAQDPRFATPSTFDVVFPASSLSIAGWQRRLLGLLVPRVRPADNVAFGLDVANEEELGLCQLTQASPYLALTFPHRADHYSRFLDLALVSEGEREEWRQAYGAFLRKLSYRYGRRLLLKSPTNTGRIGELLRLYPGARFVHIVRDPIDVYQSSMRLFETLIQRHGVLLQTFRPDGLRERVIQNYAVMHAAHFRDVDRIPPGRIHRVRYEDLVRDPLGEILRIYASLDLGPSDEPARRIRSYLESLGSYRRNDYPPLDQAVVRRLEERWAACFAEWGYGAPAS